MDREIGFLNECKGELHEVPSDTPIYRRPFSGLLERNQSAKENTSNETKHDFKFEEKLYDKIIPNDIKNGNNWVGNELSGMDAVA